MQEKVAVVIVLLSFMASLYLIVATGFEWSQGQRVDSCPG